MCKGPHSFTGPWRTSSEWWVTCSLQFPESMSLPLLGLLADSWENSILGSKAANRRLDKRTKDVQVSNQETVALPKGLRPFGLRQQHIWGTPRLLLISLKFIIVSWGLLWILPSRQDGRCQQVTRGCSSPALTASCAWWQNGENPTVGIKNQSASRSLWWPCKPGPCPPQSA